VISRTLAAWPGKAVTAVPDAYPPAPLAPAAAGPDATAWVVGTAPVGFPASRLDWAGDRDADFDQHTSTTMASNESWTSGTAALSTTQSPRRLMPDGGAAGGCYCSCNSSSSWPISYTTEYDVPALTSIWPLP
jgi:hypothetical protein